MGIFPCMELIKTHLTLHIVHMREIILVLLNTPNQRGLILSWHNGNLIRTISRVLFHPLQDPLR
jgi:hypothetical protein